MSILRVDTIIDGAVVESETFVPYNNGAFAASQQSIDATTYQRIQMARKVVDETRLYMDGKLLTVWGIGDEFLPYEDDFPAAMLTPIREVPVAEPREVKRTRRAKKAA